MKSEHTYNIYYDEEADFLEVFLGESSECYAEEVEPGIFVRKDESTDKIKSIGILGFKKRAEILKNILSRINIRIPINIDF